MCFHAAKRPTRNVLNPLNCDAKLFVLTVLLLGSMRGQVERLAKLEVAWAPTSAPPAVAEFTLSFIELRDGPRGKKKHVNGVRLMARACCNWCRALFRVIARNLRSPAQAKTKAHIPVKAGAAWEVRSVVMDAILRGSLPLGGVARRVSLEGDPNGMAAQVAVGKLMVGA